MKIVRPTRSAAVRRRTGLAPLEFVLALPLMLFVMALMINIGSVGAWKIREQTVVRNASWRTMYLRTGDANPNPPLWPAAAQVTGGAGSDASQTDVLWEAGDLATPAARGDAVSDPGQGMMIRVNRKLEMDRGVHDGSAPLERQIPLLRGVMPNGGRYRFDVAQNVLDGTWEFHHLGYADNLDRRMRLAYRIERTDYPSVAALLGQLDGGPMQALINYPQRSSLAPLDSDPDLYQLSLLPPRGGAQSTRPPAPDGSGTSPNPGYAPDFYPDNFRSQHLRRICATDPAAIQSDAEYNRFLEEIRRLPGNMARTFISWYQGRLGYLQQLPMPSAADQQEMQQLQDDIDKLNQFYNALPMANR